MTDRTCSVDGCESAVFARGWCAKHYARWRRGDNGRPLCSAQGCQKPAQTRGWCATHYSRWLRQGTVEDPKPRQWDTCLVEGCNQSGRNRGWCSKHYQRWLHHGSTADPRNRTDDGLCEVDGCTQPATTRRMCRKHAWRVKNLGTFKLPWEDMPFGTYWCRKCNQLKPTEAFYLTDGRPSSPCKACRSVSGKAYLKRKKPWLRSDVNRRRRARLRLAKTELYTALEIAERDGWRCAICRKRIGQSYAYPHPRSLSIDHIIPIAKGGDDVKSNVQSAHLHCNMSKHTGGIDQLRLIG